MKKQLGLGICMISLLLCACQARPGVVSEAANIRQQDQEVPIQLSGSSILEEMEEEEGIKAGCEYMIDGEHAVIVAYRGDKKEVGIPNEIEGYPVTEISQMAFYECENAASITKIVVPDSVTTIGALAFASLPSLEEVVLPNNLTEISSACFSMDTSLKNVVIPDGVTEIGEEAFSGCDKLIEIDIPASVSVIHANAFAKSGLENTVFHEGLVEIGSYAFAETNMRNVIFPDSLEIIGYHAFDNCYRLKNVTLPASQLSLQGFAFYMCENLSNIEFNSTRLLTGGYDFAGTNWMEKQCEAEKQFIVVNGTLLTIKNFEGEIVVPDGVTVIGGQAFVQWTEDGYGMKDNYDITGIIMPDSVEYICEDAFVQLKGVKKLVIPEMVQMVEAPQFNGWEEGQTVVVEPNETVYQSWETEWNNNKKITMVYSKKGE